MARIVQIFKFLSVKSVQSVSNNFKYIIWGLCLIFYAGITGSVMCDGYCAL